MDLETKRMKLEEKVIKLEEKVIKLENESRMEKCKKSTKTRDMMVL